MEKLYAKDQTTGIEINVGHEFNHEKGKESDVLRRNGMIGKIEKYGG